MKNNQQYLLCLYSLIEKKKHQQYDTIFYWVSYIIKHSACAMWCIIVQFSVFFCVCVCTNLYSLPLWLGHNCVCTNYFLSAWWELQIPATKSYLKILKWWKKSDHFHITIWIHHLLNLKIHNCLTIVLTLLSYPTHLKGQENLDSTCIEMTGLWSSQAATGLDDETKHPSRVIICY